MLVILKLIIALVLIILCAGVSYDLVRACKENKTDQVVILLASLIMLVPALVGLILVL